jgi:hypothetical protein
VGQAEAIVCSPPYADSVNGAGHGIDPGKGVRAGLRPRSNGRSRVRLADYTTYGTTPGQLGALKSGPCPGGEAEVGDVQTTTWGGCYKDSWKGLIVPAAYSHPAKVARGLAVRLFDHGFGRGWWRKGDLVADPFMGICGFGIIAAYKGLRFVGVEIEERFHTLCLENVALHRRRWEAGGDVPPVCLLGDSRQFAALVAGAAACVTSPPYAHSKPDHWTAEDAARYDRLAAEGKVTGHPRGKASASSEPTHYGTTPGQLGAMKAGDADSVITSPPYAGQVVRPGGRDVDNLADVPVTAEQHWGRTGPAQGHYLDAYGATPGNVGGLAAGDADGVVTSPPYEDTEMGPSPGNMIVSRPPPAGAVRKYRRKAPCQEYGTAPGQVGALRQETYWGAVRVIYGQCLLALRPGGVACVVVKGFVRRGQLVDLPGQTWRLLLSLGFRPVERIRCLLSEETREPSLFGGEEVRKRSRVSFFRRLATKRGAPEIPWEEILVVRRPPAGVP